MKFRVHKFTSRLMTSHWYGYIEPEDKSWKVYIDSEGKPHIFPMREPKEIFQQEIE